MDPQINNPLASPQTPPSPNPEPPRVPPPPPQEVSLRTMTSDMKSVERGDSMPIPETVLPPETQSEPVFKPETNIPGSPVAPQNIQKESKKTLLWVVIGVVGILGLGIGGYFLYPYLFPAAEVVTTPTPPPPPPPPVTPPHTSFFIVSPPSTVRVSLEAAALSDTAISLALRRVADAPLSEDTLQEVIVSDTAGTQIPFSNYFPNLNSAFTEEQLSGWFENDFTAFMYYDAKGVWPGYIAKFKSGADVAAFKNALSAVFEKSDLNKLFVTPAGVLQEFKDGNIKGNVSRYSIGGTAGSALNYAVLSDAFFFVSTSYPGALAATNLLGY